ncbi:hypothetical protein Tco_0164852 [Tanacetum coccineum]
MAQPQRQADVHQDELCPPNKRYALMDANKKMDLDNPFCPNESKILANILHNHPLRFSIAASSSDNIPTALSGKNKYGVGMNIPNWMITNEMKLTEHYRMYAAMFGVDVPTTQSQPIESTQGMHRTTSAPRLRIPPRRSTRLTPPTSIPTTVEADDIIQLSIAEQKRGAENVENAEVDSTTLRQNDNQNDLGTRLEPKSNKESPEVEITVVEQLVNVIEEEEESVEDDYELRRREKGKHVEESRSTPSPTTIRSPRIHSTLVSSDTEKLQELTVNNPPPSSSTPSSFSPKSKLSATNRLLSLFKPKTGRYKRYKSFFDELQGRYGYLFEHLKTRFMSRKKFNVLAQHLQEIMEESLPKMVDDRVKELTKTQVLLQQDDIPIWLALKYKFERLYMSDTHCRPSAIRPRDQDDPHDDAHLEGENSVKRQKMTEHETYVFGESSFGQANKSKSGPSMSGNQEQLDDFDFWTDSYATDDDELPIEKVLQELVEDMSQTVDEAKLSKVVNEMLRQRCTSGDEHQYHIDQMQNFLKNDIVWECRKEILVSPHPQKPTSVIQSCQRDPKAPALSLVNQDLLYLKKRSSGPEKIVMSLHKFPAVIFPDDDIEERTSRWVDDYAETGLLWSLLVYIRSTVIWEKVHDFHLAQEHQARQEDIKFYLQPYDHLTEDQRMAMDEARATINAKYNLVNVLSAQWDRCNVVVLTWIMNSVSADVYMGLVYFVNVGTVWKDLESTYDKVDGSIIFNLLHKISCLKQGGSSLADYYHRLTLLVRVDALTKLSTCDCDANKELETHNKLMKLMQFLMGLDECYMSVRSSLLTRDPLPKDLKKEIILRTSSESGGLYLYDLQSDKNIGNISMIHAFNVSKSLWHSRLGHPVDQVLVVLKDELKLSKNTNVSACELNPDNRHPSALLLPLTPGSPVLPSARRLCPRPTVIKFTPAFSPIRRASSLTAHPRDLPAGLFPQFDALVFGPASLPVHAVRSFEARLPAHAITFHSQDAQPIPLSVPFGHHLLDTLLPPATS